MEVVVVTITTFVLVFILLIVFFKAQQVGSKDVIPETKLSTTGYDYFVNSYFTNKRNEEWLHSLTTFVMTRDEPTNKLEYFKHNVVGLLFKNLIDPAYKVDMGVLFTFKPSTHFTEEFSILPDGTTVVHPLEFDDLVVYAQVMEDLYPQTQPMPLVESASSPPRGFRLKYTIPSFVNWFNTDSTCMINTPNGWSINNYNLGINQEARVVKQYSLMFKNVGIWFCEYENGVVLCMVHSKYSCRIIVSSQTSCKVGIKAPIGNFVDVNIGYQGELKFDQVYYLEGSGTIVLNYFQDQVDSFIEQVGEGFGFDSIVLSIKDDNLCCLDTATNMFAIQTNLVNQNVWDPNFMFESKTIKTQTPFIPRGCREATREYSLDYGTILSGKFLQDISPSKFDKLPNLFLNSNEFPNIVHTNLLEKHH